MTAPARLAAFAVVLALAFGTAAFAGSRLDARPDTAATGNRADSGMGAMAAEADAHGKRADAAQPVRGLAVSDRGLTLRLANATAPEGRRARLAFRIVDRAGRTVRSFDVEHTKRMHVIVVRRDMTGFEHLHPVQRPDGTWETTLSPRRAGTHRIFADFSVDGRPHTLAADLAVDGDARSRDLPAARSTVRVDGLDVTLDDRAAARSGQESALGFTVTRRGRPVAVEDYLGAKGHLVALREGDLAFLHVHPDERALEFMATFPSAGAYRLFLQFKVDGRIHTAAFTQEVSR